MKVDWSEAEDARLIAELPTVGAPKMTARLGKSIWHVRKRARQLGVKWKYPIIWKGDKVKQLAADYYSIGGPATSLKYGISTSYIRELLYEAGLQKSTRFWTKDEDHVIVTMYPSAPYSEILPKLPGRTVVAIRSRASILGVRRPHKGFRDYE